jgi:hypothetical protein
MTLNVSRANGIRLISQYFSKSVLRLMGIIEAPELQVPVVEPNTAKKRKRIELDVKKENPTCEDIKPSRKALLAARLKELEVSTCLNSCDLC